MSSSYSLRQEPRRDEPELPRLDVEELVHHLDVEELLHHLDVEEFRHDKLLRLDEQLPHDATNRRDEPELTRLDEQLHQVDVKELVYHLDVEELLHHPNVEELRQVQMLQMHRSFRMSPCLANMVPKPQPTPPSNGRRNLQAYIFPRTILNIISIRKDVIEICTE